ncbi:DJ-1/PfpI family protein [Rhodospirillaceae bacterium SYSU D60014]|uniref:DJ-1/PfpI family protein n=1 Tax=Virgifigura deserti TaxID=2268457 RepID=UPI000E6642C2
MRSTQDKTSFGIFIYDGVEPIDIGATHGVLSMAKRVLPNIAMTVIAERRGPVRLANGLTVIADHGLADCPPVDVLIVCGGPGWSDQIKKPAVLDFIRNWAPRGLLASVCTGGMILAASGVLDGLKATTRRHAVGGEPAAPLRQMHDLRPAVTPVEALLVDQGAVVTGGGVSLAIDTTLHLLERLYGPKAAGDTATTIEYGVAWRANRDALPAIDNATEVA